MTLIAGPAGVGKSRLAAEALRIAEALGLSRLVGHCSPGPTGPYAPFVTAVRRRARTLNSESLAALFDGPAFLAAALLPEAAKMLGLPEQVPHRDDLFAAVWQLFSRLAAPGGCILLLEDLHWADSDSLGLLSYLANERSDLDLWLVGTYRSDELHRTHPLTLALAELRRARLYDEIGLRPLGQEDLRQMVSAIFDGTKVSDEFIHALLDRTEGNPFFVEELIKVLVERGDIYREADTWARRDLAAIEMPITVRETLLSRARELGTAELEILQLAAVAGEHIDVPVLALAAGTASAAIDNVIREGLRLQLLAERRDGPRTTYAFRHALTREAIVDDVVGPDRQRLHQRLADALATVYTDDLDAVAAELADHFAHAGEVSKAVEFGARAARRAAASYAVEEAARRYESTLRLLSRDASERLALLLEAGRALVEGPDRRLAVAFATEAQQLARTRSDPVAEAKALMIMQRDAWESGDTQRALSMLREALVLVRGHDDWEEALVRARLARLLVLGDHKEEAAKLLPGSIELATRAENYQALSLMHGTRLLLASHGPPFEEALQTATAAARKGHDEASERNLATNAGFICLWCGDFTRSRELLQWAMDLHARFAPHDRYPEAGYIWLLSLMGEYDEVLARSGALRGVPGVPTRIVALTAHYEVLERTGAPEAAALVDELWSVAARTGESQRSVPAMAARARHALIEGQLDVGAAMCWEVLEASTTAGGTGSHWLFSPDLARALAEEEQVGELEHWVGAVDALTIGDDQDHNLVADVLCRGYLALAKGELPQGRELFGEAINRFRAMPCPAREAEALIGLADLERRAEQLDASATAARSALDVAERIGATAVADRAAQCLGRADLPAVLATVLFTDIVGSTERLSEVGDQAWRSLLERHNALVRRELSRWGGQEIDNAGDGFLAMFQTPAQGIRCALAIRNAVSAIGVQVRAGLHTGECQLSDGRLRGITVHIAARVSSAAGPGEVLVSRTVRDLVTGSSFSFEDRGAHQLKGVPGEWSLLAVSS